MRTSRTLLAIIFGAQSCTVAVAGLFSPALAGDAFTRGCELYNAKNYSQAEPIFNETVRKFPDFWPGHYYLAHTLLAEGKRAAAKKEYEAVCGCKPAPNADILSACQKVISTLGSAAVTGGSSPTTASTSSASGAKSGDDDEKAAPMNVREKAKADQIARLTKEMGEKLEALQAEMKEKLAEGEGSANTFYRFPDGTVRTSMTPDQEAAIHKEYAEKMHQLREDYRNRIAHIN